MAEARREMNPMTAPAPARFRLQPIDWMRGLVMVLMTVDHASDAFNSGRIFSDAAFAYRPGMGLPAAQFLTRWITHLCAPTFVFLAGTSLALMSSRRAQRGETPWQIDSQMIVRGLFIAALDPLWMSLGFFGWSRIIFQVLYAIGFSMVCMAALRRLPARVLCALAVVILVGVDLLVSASLGAPGAGRGSPPLPVGLLISGGRYPLPGLGPASLIIGYPLLSWLAIMMLGWAFGRRLLERKGESPAPFLAIAGIASLAAFLVLRGIDGPGNMGLHRDDNSVVQWLHVAKYPPSLTYCTLELGIMALFLSAFFAISRRAEPAWARFLGVLGASAMLFYLLHLHLLILASHALHVHAKLGLRATYLATALCVAALYYPCLRYGRYKAAHSNWFTRLV
jgi:uncharacterized membrane protein